MDTMKAPKRMHFAWVVVVACVLMLGGFACLVTQASAGPGYGIGLYVLLASVYASLIWGGILAIWLILAWIAFGESRPWHGRTWGALLPSLLLLGYGAVSVAVDPPSPQKNFQRWFRTALPTDARTIEISGPTLADAGHVHFAFRCSKPSTLELIKDLGAEPMEYSEGLESVFSPHFQPIAQDWSPTDWINARHFVKTDRTGNGYMLATDEKMERTLVARNPLWGKNEEEAAGK